MTTPTTAPHDDPSTTATEPRHRGRDLPRRARKPYGLGDVAWFALAFVGFQVAVGVLYVVWAMVTVLLRAPEGGSASLDPLEVLNAVTEVVASPPGLVVALVSQWGLFLGFPALVGKVKGFGSLAKDYGLVIRWGRDFSRALPLAVALQGLLYVVTTYLLPLTDLDLSGADNTGMVTAQTGVMLGLMVLAAVVAAPVTEEVLFRGFLLRACMRRWGGWDEYGADGVPRRTRLGGALVSALLTSAAFGALHVSIDAEGPINVAGTLALMLQTGFLGFVFALLTIRAKRLGPAIAAHLWFNGISVLLALLSA